MLHSVTFGTFVFSKLQEVTS